jgi:diacylglycerol kinase family enzyme
MDETESPDMARRAAAVATYVMLALATVVALALTFTNLGAIVVAWLGTVVTIAGVSFWMRAVGRSRPVWLLVAVLGVLLTIGGLIALAYSSIWALLVMLVVGAVTGVLASYALQRPSHGRTPLAASNPVLFINPHSGGGKATKADLATVAAERGIKVEILEAGSDLTAMARNAIASGADVVGAAGGDGSLGYVATAAIESDVPFICIPAGTRNHFARDLGLDRDDLIGALDAFQGEVRKIDYGTVGDRVYLNVASLGMYAETVSDPAYRDAKVATTKKMLQSVAESGLRFALEYQDDRGDTHETADLIMVSVDSYQISPKLSDIGKRARLDTGNLGIVTFAVEDPETSLERVKSSITWGTGLIPGLTHWQTKEFTVDSSSKVPLGIDGETVKLDPPLQFRVHPRGLNVAVPVGTPNGPRVNPLGTDGAFQRLWRIAQGDSAVG